MIFSSALILNPIILMHAAAQEIPARQQMFRRLNNARAQTDELFSLLPLDAMYDRPIPERHRIIFYLGHLEAFDWNLIGRHLLDAGAVDGELDRLFAFGIDPVDGHLPSDQPSDWPSEAQVRNYARKTRDSVDAQLKRASFSGAHRPLLLDDRLLHVAIEHRLMHAETFAYMLHQLPLDRKRKPRGYLSLSTTPKALTPQMIEVPEGIATLGLSNGGTNFFGWDNEFQAHTVKVPRFRIDAYNVTNGEFLAFAKSGGYNDKALWSPADWEWMTATGIRHPSFWIKTRNGWNYRGMFEEIPLPLDWPVFVSHAEASAYVRWKGKTLPTEAQWHRAAVGAPNDVERTYPWGNQAPGFRYGNFDFHRWDPVPVGSHTAGSSAFGVHDLLGNGWEWTSSLFEPFAGFERFSFYPGYSANFFDGKHFVMKGASPRTAACMLRRSFRNWFQTHYPYIYATFRCVENEASPGRTLCIPKPSPPV